MREPVPSPHDLRAPLARAKTAAKLLAAAQDQKGEGAAYCQLLLEALEDLELKLAHLPAPEGS